MTLFNDFAEPSALRLGLSKKSVCVMFGDQCCTYILNNAAPEGSFNCFQWTDLLTTSVLGEGGL